MEGYDPDDGNWITANKVKRNKKDKERRKPKANNEELEGKPGDKREGEEEQNVKTAYEVADATKSKHDGHLVCRGGPKQPVCEEPVEEDDDDSGVSCIKCGMSFHASCQGVAKPALLALRKYDMLRFVCSYCQENISLNITVPRSTGSLAAIEAKIAKLETLIKNNTQSVNKFLDAKERERSFSETSEEVTSMQSGSYAEAVKGTCDEVLKKVTEKIKTMTKEDKEKREENIVLHNIPESRSDIANIRQRYDENSFVNIVHALLGEDRDVEITQTYRIGKRLESKSRSSDDSKGRGEVSKPRLLLVKLKRKEDVEHLLRLRWYLKDAGFPNIYMTRDLPPEEREVQRKLRDELKRKGKDSHRIFRGQVVPKDQHKGHFPANSSSGYGKQR